MLRARLGWTDSADPTAYTTLHFAYTGSEPSSSDCSNLAAAIANAFGTCKAHWDTGTVLSTCQVTDLTSDTAGQGNSAVDFVGTSGGTLLSGATSLVVNYTIARRYRGGKPRSYLPWGTTENLETKQQWDPSFLAAVGSDVAACFSTIIGTSEGGTTISNHVNVSYYNGFTVVNPGGGKRAKNVPVLRSSPLVDTITGRTFLAFPGSQRRRNRV